jgi:hypothetical protein
MVQLCSPQRQAHNVNIGGHVGHLELSGLVLGDGLGELLTLLDVGQSDIKRCLRCSQRTGPYAQSADTAAEQSSQSELHSSWF